MAQGREGIRVERLSGDRVRIEVSTGADSAVWFTDQDGRSFRTKLDPDPGDPSRRVAIVSVPHDAVEITVATGEPGKKLRWGIYPIYER